MNKKRKILLASVIGITTSVLVFGNMVGNKFAEEEGSFITPPPEQ